MSFWPPGLVQGVSHVVVDISGFTPVILWTGISYGSSVVSKCSMESMYSCRVASVIIDEEGMAERSHLIMIALATVSAGHV